MAVTRSAAPLRRPVAPGNLTRSEERAQTQKIEGRGDKSEREGDGAKFSQRYPGHTLGSPEEVEAECDQDGDAGRGVNEEPQGERQVYDHARSSQECRPRSDGESDCNSLPVP